MTEKFDFNQAVYNLINTIEEPNMEKLRKNKPAIHELAEYCRKTGIYKHAEEKKPTLKQDFLKDHKDPLELYKLMLHKIVGAPVKIMADGVVILYMPILDELITDKCSKCGKELPKGTWYHVEVEHITGCAEHEVIITCNECFDKSMELNKK